MSCTLQEIVWDGGQIGARWLPKLEILEIRAPFLSYPQRDLDPGLGNVFQKGSPGFESFGGQSKYGFLFELFGGFGFW